MIDATAKKLGSTVVPVMRYRNLPAAIDWLCKAFGFEKQRVAVDRNGAISYAQLTFGGGSLIMVGPVRASAFDKLMKQPDEIGGAETQVCYFYVADAHVHCARAVAAGAEIIFDVEDRANGGRSYSCRDPEGHLWNFGTYNPWLHHALGHVPARSTHDRPAALAKRLLLAAGLLGSVAAIIMPANRIPDPDLVRGEGASIETGSIRTQEDPPALDRLVRHQTVDAEAQNATVVAERLAKTLLELDALRKTARDTREQLAQATSDKQAADRLVNDLRYRLASARADKNAAERAVKEARLQLIRERTARNAWQFP